jgi:hypothetical protein
LVRKVGAGDDNDAAGFAVETMHDAGAEIVSVEVGERSKVMQQCVDKRAMRVTGAGVNNHAGRFIHHHNIVVLIKNFEGQRFGLGAQRREIGGRQRDGVVKSQSKRGASRGGIHLRAILFNPGLNARAAVGGQALMQEGVEALAGVGGAGCESE